MKCKKAVFPFTMGTFAFACFLTVVLLMSSSVQPPWGRVMVLLLPSVILYAVAFLSANGKLSSRKTAILTVVLTIILLLASVFYVFLLSIWTATTETTDVRYYSRAYKQIDDEEGVEGIFPAAVPPDVADVSFRYHPQFLQGGEVFELSYVVSDETLSKWERQLEQNAEWVGSNAEWHRVNNWGFYDSDSTRYHLYWDGGFNHGEMSYVLIDFSVNRITFYYTDW